MGLRMPQTVISFKEIIIVPFTSQHRNSPSGVQMTRIQTLAGVLCCICGGLNWKRFQSTSHSGGREKPGFETALCRGLAKGNDQQIPAFREPNYRCRKRMQTAKDIPIHNDKREESPTEHQSTGINVCLQGQYSWP
jgi:hypothetical protein